MGVKKIAIVIFIVLIIVSLVIFLLTKNNDGKKQNTVVSETKTTGGVDTSKQNNNNSDNNSENTSTSTKDKHGILLNEVPKAETEVELDFNVIDGKIYLEGSKIQYILFLETEYDNTKYKFDLEVTKNEYLDALNKRAIKAQVEIIKAGGRGFISLIKIF